MAGWRHLSCPEDDVAPDTPLGHGRGPSPPAAARRPPRARRPPDGRPPLPAGRGGPRPITSTCSSGSGAPFFGRGASGTYCRRLKPAAGPCHYRRAAAGRFAAEKDMHPARLPAPWSRTAPRGAAPAPARQSRPDIPGRCCPVLPLRHVWWPPRRAAPRGRNVWRRTRAGRRQYVSWPALQSSITSVRCSCR